MSERVELLDMNICYLRVCSDLPLEELTVEVNKEWPCVTSGGWVLVEDELPSGDAPVVTCGKDASKKHVVFVAGVSW